MSSEVKRSLPGFDEHYETMSRTIRWVIVALVLISYPMKSDGSIVMITLMAAIAIYNLLRYDPKLRPLGFFSSRANGLAVDHVFALALISLTGGLASPYYPLVFLLILAAIASYGIAGFAYSLSSQLVMSFILLNFDLSPVPNSPEFQFVIKIIIIIIFSLVAEQSVRTRDEEYLLESSFAKEVENERHRLKSLINALSVAFLAVDDHGKVYLYNAAALDLLNIHHNIKGHHIGDLLPLHDTRGHRVNLLHLVPEAGPLNRQDLTYQASDGSTQVFDIAVSTVHAFGQQRGGGYLVMIRDITKEKSLNDQRDEFISVISHELRTPLAIAEANLSTALLPGYAHIDPKAQELLEQAHQNTVFLSELIQDLTTISRAERDDQPLDLKLVDVSDLAHELARDYRAQAEAKHLNFRLELADGLGNVVTDPAELREILQNFLTNAIKYTSAGSVTLAVNRLPEGTEFLVKDTGIGISASDKPKIFNKFYRSEDYRTRQTGGTGLGLYITHKLSEKLGLEISFASKLNHGSVFRILVPVRNDQTVRQVLAAEAAADPR